MAHLALVDEIWDGTKRNRGKNYRGPYAWGWGSDGALGNKRESQECGHRCHRTDVVGQTHRTQFWRFPTLHNQESGKAPGGGIREKTCSGCLWYDKHREGSHSEEGPQAVRATVSTVRLT